jgi:hypothetical protein
MDISEITMPKAKNKIFAHDHISVLSGIGADRVRLHNPPEIEKPD